MSNEPFPRRFRVPGDRRERAVRWAWFPLCLGCCRLSLWKHPVELYRVGWLLAGLIIAGIWQVECLGLVSRTIGRQERSSGRCSGWKERALQSWMRRRSSTEGR